MPDTRLKIPLEIRASYFFGDNVIIRTYYRYYTDDWSLKAHTSDLEIPVKLTQAFSLSPFYRYYTQTGTKYFKPYGEHTTADEYWTSSYGCVIFYDKIILSLFLINFNNFTSHEGNARQHKKLETVVSTHYTFFFRFFR